MTPHQFRHLAAALYLKAHPEDFETVRQLLGHAWAKTTLIHYAGLSGERASGAYLDILREEQERLSQKGKAKAGKGRKTSRQKTPEPKRRP